MRDQHFSFWAQKDSKSYNSHTCIHVHSNSRISNSILSTMCDDESEAGSNRTVIKQSCINKSLFLCGSLGIVCLNWRPVFIKQKKSPNKIRSHLDRKCSFLLPGIQTVEILPHIVNLPWTHTHTHFIRKPVLLTGILKLTPEVYCTSVQVHELVFKRKSRFMASFPAHQTRFSGFLIVKHARELFFILVWLLVVMSELQ